MSQEHVADVIVVGAGAAGLATAIFAARAHNGLRVVALDGARKIGAKILVSGGGRCNVTNVCVDPADFYGGNPNVIKRVLAALPADATRAFFAEIGVALHEEEYGKLFPDSNSARTVVKALLDEANTRGVDVRCGQRVVAIARDADGFVVSTNTEAGPMTWRAAQVVLATGGLSLPKTGSDGFGYTLATQLGHSLVPTTPALDPLVLAGEFHAPLSGVAHDVELIFHAAAHRKPVRIRGPLLWTHFGVSGPAALNVSRFWNHAALAGDATARLSLSFVDGLDFAAVDAALVETAAAQPRAQATSALRRWLPARIAEAVCAAAGVRPDQPLAQMPRELRRRLVHTLTEFPLPVQRSRGYTHAEVTAGGVALSEIDPGTMASRVCPGLYLVGEILDVDGRLGGFNFQWAWSSAFVAGQAIAKAATR